MLPWQWRDGFVDWLQGLLWGICNVLLQWGLDLFLWFGNWLFFLACWLQQYLWNKGSTMVFDGIAYLGGLLNLPSISEANMAIIFDWFKAVNYFVPVDMLIAILPSWAAFKVACMVLRVGVKLLRG